MMRGLIALAAAGALTATPCLAAELPDEGFRPATRSGAVAGLYLKLPLGAPRSAERAPRTGLRLAMTHDVRSVRSFAQHREANLLDLRFASAGSSFFLAGQPVAGPEADRLNAAGGSGGGRLDKIMIGAGIALAVTAGAVFVLSVD